MKIELIDFTGKGTADETWYAANLLLFAKSTRLNMSPAQYAEIQARSESTKRSQLAEIASTIRSSWEFVDVTFLISGISRAAAQQVTRTRTASFAMQSQRVNELTDAEFVNPGKKLNYLVFAESYAQAVRNYATLIENGAPPEDARSVLPLGTQTNLLAKYNLRAFVDLVASRRSLRTQGEYRELIEKMYGKVIDIWPWSVPFFRSEVEAAITILESVVVEYGIKVGSGAGWKIAKAIDLLRRKA